ncbi:M61 family metallopeptidase [Salinimicrobium soli]|uniref:M61 family metallopeptidase n=1 Tax=Salinimicrobium soli TaxID=1254399 RepID=UPI003AAABDAF
MKKIFLAFGMSLALVGCKTSQGTTPEVQPVVTSIDLVNVIDDRVRVTIDPAEFKTEETVFYIPKTVPGTYSTADYGKYSEDFKAYDYNGKELKVQQLDANSWRIPNARNLDKVGYWVNDTFDISGEGGIYSMAGTNIAKGKNFLLNLFGFIGYFQEMKEEPYRLMVTRPSDLIPGTALTVQRTENKEGAASKVDVFELNRYFEVMDNPIMYSTPDTTSFKVPGMTVLLDVYSPNKRFSAESIKPNLERTIRAQKNFLGDVNNTDKYAILLYLSATPGNKDAGNFGALEHHSSTVVVMPETMEEEALDNSLTDIVSHEFFHIITPLGVHSNEIHYFDYNDPKMSKHLWMYEGVTEYFANLFQVNQGLIDNQDFYDRMNEKIMNSRNFDDTMSFTVMSENILDDEYAGSYANVYQKGALIGMALDIRLRELSNGEFGVLDLMKALTDKYGKDKPFNDEDLISDIVEITYPEIQEFFDRYVSGTTPIPYHEFFNKVGLEMQEGQIPVSYLLKDQATPYITLNEMGAIMLRNDIELNSFLVAAGLQGGDMIKSINGTKYTASNIYDLVMTSLEWKEGENIRLTIARDGEEKVIEAEVIEPMAKGMKLVENPNATKEQAALREAWLKS